MRVRNEHGFSFAEMMVVVAIASFMMAGLFTIFITGQSTWFTADASMDSRDNIRVASEKIARELHESGFDSAGTYQVTILDGAGANATDILRFSIPVLCQSNTSILDASGNVAYWGAPLTWGCTTSSCMDADNTCGTVEYKYIQYEVNSSNQLVRKALSPALAVVRQDTIALYITNFQVTKSADQNVVTLQLTAQKQSGMHRTVSLTKSLDVYLRNRG